MAGLEIGRRYSKPADYQQATSFDQLKLDSRLLDALKAANLDSPTAIQVHTTHNAPFCLHRLA
jgi:superfamily II DNA/RNA helicase